MLSKCIDYNSKYFIFILLLVMTSCQHNETKPLSNIHIDFFKSQSSLKESNLSVENTFVILSEDSVGANLLKQIDKIIVKDSIIYVADTYMKNLFLYDIKGNFIASVGEKGEGPNGNLSLSDFCVDDKGNIYWYDGIKNRVQIYNKNLSLENHHKIPFKAECLQWQNGSFLFSLAPYNADPLTKGKCIAYTDSLFVLKETFFNYDKNVDLNVEFYSPFVPISEGVSYNRAVNNNVFIFCDGVVKTNILFDFAHLNVKEEFLSNLNRMFEKEEEYCYIASTPIFYKNFILGCLNKSGELFTFIYDMKIKKSYMTELTEYDSEGINVPLSLSDSGNIISFVNQDIYPDFNDDKNLSEEMKKTLEVGGFLVCISKIKVEL